MDKSTAGKWLVVIGVVFLVLSLVLPSFVYPLYGFGGMFGAFGLIFIIAGIALWVVGRKRVGALMILKRLSFNRHDIIQATNWIRLGIAEFRRPIGASLILIGFILLILELIFGPPFPLLAIWIIVIAVGTILLIWKPISITHDFTKKILIKIPDLFSVHTFHTILRQCLEEAGYIISENLSPGEGSSLSTFNNDIYLLKGGVRATKKQKSPSKSLVPELSKTPVISNIFTLFSFGILFIFLGLTLMVHGITNWMGEDWAFIVMIIGLIVMLIGVVFLIYDYIKRTSKFAQIYVLEEGTAYIPKVNIYNPRILDKPALSPQPNVSVSHTSCELVVTVSATRNRFFDAEELENDFKTITSSIENIIKENTLKLKDVTSALFV